MSYANADVSYTVSVDFEYDQTRVTDNEYIEELTEQVKEQADRVMETTPTKGEITWCDIDEMAEV